MQNYKTSTKNLNPSMQDCSLCLGKANLMQKKIVKGVLKVVKSLGKNFNEFISLDKFAPVKILERTLVWLRKNSTGINALRFLSKPAYAIKCS